MSQNQTLRRFPDDLYRAHAHYNRWMNERLYDCAAQLSDEQRKRDMKAFFGSVHLTLTHILIADRTWLARFGCAREVWKSLDERGEPITISGMNHDLYPDFDRLRGERRRTDADIDPGVTDLAIMLREGW